MSIATRERFSDVDLALEYVGIPMVPGDEKKALRFLKGYARPAKPMMPIVSHGDVAHTIHRLQQAGWMVKEVCKHTRRINGGAPEVRHLVTAEHYRGGSAVCFGRIPLPTITKEA